MEKRINGTLFELNRYMEALYVYSFGGINAAVDSFVADVDKKMFSSYRVVSHGQHSDVEPMATAGSFWNLFLRSLVERCACHVDIWGLSVVTGEWRIVAEYQPEFDFPLVTCDDLLETPEFRDITFACQVSIYGGRYWFEKRPLELLDLNSEDDAEFVSRSNGALLEGRGVVSPRSCVAGLFGRFTDQDGNLVGGSLEPARLRTDTVVDD